MGEISFLISYFGHMSVPNNSNVIHFKLWFFSPGTHQIGTQHPWKPGWNHWVPHEIVDLKTILGSLYMNIWWTDLYSIYFANIENSKWIYLEFELLFENKMSIVNTGQVVTDINDNLYFAGAELIWNDNFKVNGMQITAYVLISASFPLNIFPERWYDNLVKAVNMSKDDVSRDNRHMTPRERLRHSTVYNGSHWLYLAYYGYNYSVYNGYYCVMYNNIAAMTPRERLRHVTVYNGTRW